jgi:hypothetical protein
VNDNEIPLVNPPYLKNSSPLPGYLSPDQLVPYESEKLSIKALKCIYSNSEGLSLLTEAILNLIKSLTALLSCISRAALVLLYIGKALILSIGPIPEPLA